MYIATPVIEVCDNQASLDDYLVYSRMAGKRDSAVRVPKGVWLHGLIFFTAETKRDRQTLPAGENVKGSMPTMELT